MYTSFHFQKQALFSHKLQSPPSSASLSSFPTQDAAGTAGTDGGSSLRALSAEAVEARLLEERREEATAMATETAPVAREAK